jgi:hypothetical protein
VTSLLAHVIDTINAAGLRVAPASGGMIMVAPLRRLTDELRALIVAHKAELVDWLEAANEPDPDRWCWPHSSAMNTPEIATFGARVVRFMVRGLSAPEAERLADRLVKNDRDQDGLHCCLECANLRGTGPHAWRCATWGDAGIGAAALGRDLAITPQLCPAFVADRLPHCEKITGLS